MTTNAATHSEPLAPAAEVQVRVQHAQHEAGDEVVEPAAGAGHLEVARRDADVHVRAEHRNAGPLQQRVAKSAVDLHQRRHESAPERHHEEQERERKDQRARHAPAAGREHQRRNERTRRQTARRRSTPLPRATIHASTQAKTATMPASRRLDRLSRSISSRLRHTSHRLMRQDQEAVRISGVAGPLLDQRQDSSSDTQRTPWPAASDAACAR